MARQVTNYPNSPLEAATLPGPTGESNQLSMIPRGMILCLGPEPKDFAAQVERAESTGNSARVSQIEDLANLATVINLAAVCYFADDEDAREIRIALSKRDGPIVPLIGKEDPASFYQLEKHVCTDTTAAGGNATLLAEAG